MKKIFLSTQIPEDKTAASKAKVDVKEILESDGYQTVYFPRIRSLSAFYRFWKSLSTVTERGSHIVLEYPVIPRRRVWIVAFLCFWKRIPLYGVIHDISDLRFPEYEQRSDMWFLNRFDGLVSHNASMTAWLRKKGYRKPVVNLNVFDYRLQEQKDFHAGSLNGKLRVLYAGNLSHQKATYIYDPGIQRLKRLELCVYGQHFEQERMNGSQVSYKGVFNPGDPNLPETYHFGLIWEGTSLDACEGQYGQYIRFNNPHKFSLYLSLGLPVIVWKEAAIAPYILQNGIGLTIESLSDLDELAATVTPEAYQGMAANVRKLACKVREGYFLRTALEKLTHPGHA